MAAVAHRQGEHPHPSGSRHPQTAGSSHDANANAMVRKKSSAQPVNERNDAKMIGQWRIGRTIGKGSSGRVKIAKHSITGKYAAIKIVPKGLIVTSRMSVSEAGARADKVLLGIEREIVIMKLIDHPNVLNLYDVWETSAELYLIMEYVPGGELFDYLVKRGRLPVSEALHYFQQIIHAVDYCHRFNICHRDLKPENLLLDKDKNIKVADFGMAAWEAGERMLETSCGSPHYASPEIVAGKAYHGSSSDIWSCGIILFALLTGRLPFDDDNIRSLLQKVKIGVFEMPDEIVDPARDLLSRMLEKDPERRITMPEILRHPFFVSRSPRPIPGRSLVSPPALDEVDNPVSSPEEIDPDIMGNLKTLWSGATEDEIVIALMSKDKTWEKAIYHLLVKYRNKHLENYNMEDDDDEAVARRQARRAQSATASSAFSPAKRKGGPQAQAAVAVKPRLTPLGENETIQDRVSSPPPARPSAPTPKKAAAQATVESLESPVPSRPASKLVTPRSPIGPRPPISNRGSYASGSGSSDNSTVPTTPAIVLQEATPTKEILPAPSRPTSVMASPVMSSPPLESAQLPPLNVPHVQDEQLQHFFNEIAIQLNTMNIRSSVASGSSTTSSAILGTDYQAYLAFVNGGASTTSPILEEENDPNQFADADDDNTDAASIHSTFTAASIMAPQSPLIGLGLGGPPPGHGARPNLYPAPPPNQQRWSYASSHSSSRGTPAVGYPAESPTLSFPSPTIAPITPQWERPETETAEILQATRVAPRPPPRIASRPAPPRPGFASTSAPRRPLPEPSLPREGSYVMIEDAGSVASDPMASWGSKQSGFSAHRGQDAFGMLKKKKKVIIEPVPFSPDLSGASSPSTSGPSPKRSWFNNLFSFKPAPCTLVSHLNISETRERTRKLLAGMNVRTAVVEIDGLRGLKCRVDEVRDTNGMSSTKGVRFRVEFSRGASSPSGVGYNTLVSLTLEKGAQSSFKDIFGSLRHSFGDAQRQSPTSARPPVQQAHSFSFPSSSARPHASSISNGSTNNGGNGNGNGNAPHLSAPHMRWTSSAPNTPIMPSSPQFPSKAPGSVRLPSAIRF